MASVLVLHGPNLNLLGSREPGVYGNVTLAELDADLRMQAIRLGVDLDVAQYNAESEMLERIHHAPSAGVGFIVINPAAWTHSSIALRDALLGVGIPFVEVHLSNVHAREPFRRHSYFSDIAVGVISGLGSVGYRFALQVAADTLSGQGSRHG